ncbi:MAG: OmpA family protein [Paludibacteraceae bacterium]|nr:OmpA family protein [Paludibacteraceae bacterium]
MKKILIALLGLCASVAQADEKKFLERNEILPLKACNYEKETSVSSLNDKVAFMRGGQIFVCNSTNSWEKSDFTIRKDLQQLEIDGPFTQYYSTLYYSSGGRLFSATLKNGEWITPQELVIQGYKSDKEDNYWGSTFAYRRWIYRSANNFNEGMHNPAIASKGRRLYFVSEMEGGKGGKDIWYMDWDSFSQFWSTPVNASELNTEYDEDFPFVSNDTMLYFSSNRPASFKKYNIYKYNLTEDHPRVEILCSGFNGDSDDMNFIFAGGTPFFISTRRGGQDVFCPQDRDDDEIIFNYEKDHRPTLIEKKDSHTIVFYFDTNKTTMVSSYENEFNAIYDFINEDPNCKVKIIGYTDERGKEANNMNLSIERAKTVYNQLVKMGISKNRLSYEGAGSSNPIVKKATTESDHQKNRRVEIIKQ